ncbi:MAG: hypothetical protein GYA17_13780 [Chloroflexi bacterium]|nr:hypothetical protein [Chloroflexota bacterium]
MNCQRIRDLLPVYVDGEASSVETRLVQDHLASCAACRSELDRLAGVQLALRQTLQAMAEEAGPPPGAWGSIQSQLVMRETVMQTQPVKSRFIRPRLAWVALFLLLVALGVAGFNPWFQQQFLKWVGLGPYSDAAQIEAPAPGAPDPLPEDRWVLRTEIGGFGGGVAPGESAEVLSFATLPEAQAQVPYPILRPGSLPEGYTLREVKLAPTYGTFWVFQFYAGPGHDILVAQFPGGPQPSSDPNTLSANKVGAMTTGELDAVDLDGRPAAWMDGHTLMWAEGNITYEVGGLDLDLEQAQAIARSLQ